MRIRNEVYARTSFTDQKVRCHWKESEIIYAAMAVFLNETFNFFLAWIVPSVKINR